MTNYASMRALDVWYDRIDLQRYQGRSADPKVLAEMRRRFAQRIEEARRKSMPNHLFPKLAEHQGEGHRMKTSRR